MVRSSELQMGMQSGDKARCSSASECTGAFRPRGSALLSQPSLIFPGYWFCQTCFPLCEWCTHEGTSATFCYCEETPGARQLTEGWVFTVEAEPTVAREAWLQEQETGRPHLHPSQRAEVNRKWGESMNSESTSSNDILPPARLRLPELPPRQNNTPNLGPSFQISKPPGDASHSNHHRGQGGASGVSASATFSLIAMTEALRLGGCLASASWVLPSSAVQCRGCRHMQPWLRAAEALC